MKRLLAVILVLSAGVAETIVAAEPAADASWLFSDEPLFPELKNRDLGGGWTATGGGEYRNRYMDERNRLRPLGELRRDTYNLIRFTPFAELKHENVTLYVQGIDAESYGEDLPPVPIDVNRFDLLQYYADFNLVDFEEGGQLRFKVGRQLLLYGSQHLVSPLGWSNTFRNFEGLKLYYSDDVWSLDAFVVKPVNGAASPAQFRPYSRDEWDSSQTFSGVYATYKSLPSSKLDVYWLWLYDDEGAAARLDGDRHTVGARLAGSSPFFSLEELAESVTLTWDLEAAYQFGRDAVLSPVEERVRAGFVSTNTGFVFNQLPWTPAIAGIYFWGSGDADPTDGTSQTFSTLFPLGHAYWGQIDNFNGSNLRDVAIQTTVKPTERLSLVAQYHFFDKNEAADAIWNVAGAAVGNRTTPATDLGQELDLVATMQFNKNLQVQAGYFWFWYGEAVSQNAGIPRRKDAQQFYLMTTWGF